MKFLVTGSSGFIGTQVVGQLLAAGHEVAGFDQRDPIAPAPGLRHFSGNLVDRERVFAVMAEMKPEVLIHLAAKTSLKVTPPGHPRFLPNTQGTLNLMEAGRAAGSLRRTIFTSTKYVYREPPPALHRVYAPTTDYGRSKAAMEELIWEHDGMATEWCIVRPTTIWGPGVGPHYQGFFKLVRDGRYVNFGSGASLKHLGYIENTAWQICRLAQISGEQIHRKVLYVGDYDAIRVGDWAEAFRRAFDAPRVRSVPLPLARFAARCGDALVACGWKGFPLTTFRFRNLTEDDLCDMEPTRAICGEVPVDLAEAARRTARWFEQISKEGEK